MCKEILSPTPSPGLLSLSHGGGGGGGGGQDSGQALAESLHASVVFLNSFAYYYEIKGFEDLDGQIQDGNF